MDMIDRRLNPSGKSLPNRQRFLRRARKAIRDSVRDASAERSIKDAGEGGAVAIPVDGIDEPRFRIGSKGSRERILPGNREFVEGDRLPRPPGSGQGEGSGSGSGSGGGGEDEFQVVLSASEFLDFFLEDLELPDLERTKLSKVETEGVRRAGFTTTGSPMNLAVTRTMRTAMSRRIALKRPTNIDIAAAETALENASDAETRAQLDAELAQLRQRTRAIPYIDPIDLRYRRLEPTPRPIAQAVVFCLMDVSGSMSQHMKDIAKRFFMLLYVFLSKRYKHVDVVFVRHTDEAKEVGEEIFFKSRETGGTRVSSALTEMLRIVGDRYSPADWNIYVAQASDGDNEPNDNDLVVSMMSEKIIPICQYYAYLEVDEPHHHGSSRSSLWRAFEAIAPEPPAMRRVTSRQEIYPVFRELFRRDRAEQERA
jgi:uncharacterized protein